MEEKLKIGELVDTILKIKETERYKKWLIEVQEDKKYEKKFPKLFKEKYGIRWVGEVPALPKKDEEDEEDGFEKASKKAKKALNETEAIQREIGIRLVRKPGESFKDYLKRLREAKKKKRGEK